MKNKQRNYYKMCNNCVVSFFTIAVKNEDGSLRRIGSSARQYEQIGSVT